jgi:3-deoxy-D-manno-octulosonic-acid transferase
LPDKQGLRVWIHAASVGEFEQARPLITELKKNGALIFVSFLSVSGYEARKNFNDADLVCYLPEDTRSNAKHFIDLLRPDVLLLMRYDFWLNSLVTASDFGARLILANAVLRQDSAYLKLVSKNFYRFIFSLFEKIFVVSITDAENFKTAFDLEAEVAGDSRFDQVLLRSRSTDKISRFKEIYHGKRVLVAGSTWQADEEILIPAFKTLSDVALIIVPHEIGADNVSRLENLLRGENFSLEKVSALSENFSGDRVLIIDQIGYLAELYSIASVAYVGGGFGVNVHSVLEAAVFGVPTVYGHRIRKSREAKDLSEEGASIMVQDGVSLQAALQKFFTDETARIDKGLRAAQYVTERLGATQKILKYLMRN